MLRYLFLILLAGSLGFPACYGAASDSIPSDAQIVQLSNSNRQIATWSADGQDHYAINQDGRWHIVEATSYQIKLRFSEFDPAQAQPLVPENLKLDAKQADSRQVYIVQFLTQPIQEYRDAISELGGKLHQYLAKHSYLVELTAKQRDQVAELPFVRWVGAYEPAYKVDESFIPILAENPAAFKPMRLNIMVHERGPEQKQIVAEQINAIGGMIHALIPDGFILESTLDGNQLIQILSLPEVAWVDLWTPYGEDMDIARMIGGADYIETVAGFTGQGVRGEVMDSNLFQGHVDFQDIPPIFHGNRSGNDSHGTASYGVVFARGVGDPAGRGMIPDAQGIFADYGFLSNRYTHTAEIVQAPYLGVFQTNSWGNSQTSAYNSISTEMDDIIFINDLLITQSQSNLGSTLSRPQAWAKNIVAVGGVDHFNTLTKADDQWNNASIGPAQDGRIKPDLCHFYDSIYTTDDSVNDYRQFGGTSGATPITAGHFGLFFQMWSEGVFGNDVDPDGTVFENRPHSTTAKAMLINSADSYPFSGANANMTRTHQGWGMADVARLYDLKDNTFIVNEELVLSNLEEASFDLNVAAGQDELRATMVYLDPAGTTSSNQHRINDLSLRVTAPNGTIYWGNNGLRTGNYSTSGGTANDIDTVENVFIEAPEPGVWNVTVIASEINQDSHVETAAVDADFALVVSGVTLEAAMVAPDSYVLANGEEFAGDVGDLADSDDEYLEFLSAKPQDGVAPLSVLMFTELANSQPGQLSITMEERTSTPGLNYTIEVFNFVSNQFVELDDRNAAFNEDQSVTYEMPGNDSHFVEPNTGNTIARMTWRPTGVNLMFQWRVWIDNVVWTHD